MVRAARTGLKAVAYRKTTAAGARRPCLRHGRSTMRGGISAKVESLVSLSLVRVCPLAVTRTSALAVMTFGITAA